MIKKINLKFLSPILLLIGFSFSSFANASDFFGYKWNDSDPYLLSFVKGNRADLVRQAEFSYNNGLQYREFIEQRAAKYKIPREIYALAAVESSFNPKAVSHANAKGMWQFMKGTGSDMGLNVGGTYDERHD